MSNFQQGFFNLAIAGTFTLTAACTVSPSADSRSVPKRVLESDTVGFEAESPVDSIQSFPDAGEAAQPQTLPIEADATASRASAEPVETQAAISPAPAQTVEPIAEAAPVSIPCETWQTHRQQYGAGVTDYVLPLLPHMPTGFQNGCTFLEIMTMSNPTYVLRNGIALNRVLYAAALEDAGEDGTVSTVRGDRIDFDALAALAASGDVIKYYAACTTTGRQQSYCDEYPRYLPYILPRPFSLPNDPDKEAACFQGHCLESETIPVTELVKLWDYWQAPVPVENQAIRDQYTTIPLDAVMSEPRSVTIFSSEKETFALQTFGRTTLEEGEDPSVVIDEGYQGDFDVVMLVNQGAADDSIGGVRYRIEFESVDGDQVVPVWVGQQQFCRRSREWTMERCP